MGCSRSTNFANRNIEVYCIIMKRIFTEKAPKPIGPFSQALDSNNFIFLSGQVGVNPSTGKIESEDVQHQTRQIFENIKSVMAEAGLDLGNIVKTTVFLKNMNDFGKMNDVYAAYFSEPYPARSAVQVSRLPLDALIEIECIAVKDSSI